MLNRIYLLILLGFINFKCCQAQNPPENRQDFLLEFPGKVNRIEDEIVMVKLDCDDLTSFISIMEKRKAEARISITFNNCVSDSSLTSGPGFAAMVTFNGFTIMFDTGSNYLTLLENMQAMGLDFTTFDAIVISHIHWDHLFGLPGIAGVRNFKINTFVPASSIEAVKTLMPRLTCTSVDSCMELFPGIWSTGGLGGNVKDTYIDEQALILEQADGLTVLVGCAHPGLEKIISFVKHQFPGKPVKLLAGGFHLQNKSLEELQELSDFLRKSDVRKLAPSHCTGDNAITFFKEKWKDSFVTLFLGDSYTIK